MNFIDHADYYGWRSVQYLRYVFLYRNFCSCGVFFWADKFSRICVGMVVGFHRTEWLVLNHQLLRYFLVFVGSQRFLNRTWMALSWNFSQDSVHLAFIAAREAPAQQITQRFKIQFSTLIHNNKYSEAGATQIWQWVFYLFVQSLFSLRQASRRPLVSYTKILFGTESFRLLAFKSSHVRVISLFFFFALYHWVLQSTFGHLRTCKYKFRFKYIYKYIYISLKPWRCMWALTR